MNMKAKQFGPIIITILLLTGAVVTVKATSLGDDILSQWVNATWLKGDGGNITNVDTNNIPNFTVAARNSISAGTNLTYNSTTGKMDYIVPSGSSSYNATYDATTSTVNGNLIAWNSTYNATYDAKAPTNSPTFTGTVTMPYGFNVGATTTTATGTEINNLNGTTSNIQTQLNGKQASGTYVTAVSGGTSPITSTGTTSITLGCTAASTSVSGCLSSTDWNTFNGKQAALGYTAENTANKNAASGYAGLDSSSHLTPSQVNFFMTQSVVTASRTFAVVYRNTGTRSMMVVVSLGSTSGTPILYAYTDSSASPTTEVWRGAATLGSNYDTAMFIVLPNNYYELTRSTTGGAILDWTEWS